MNNKSYISVIIPTYRPQAYLWECLASLKEQTLPTEQYEVLIVLNGDKEPFYQQIVDFISGHNNMHLLYTQTSGVSNARNIGLDNAQGEYVAFVDDDDYVSKNYLKSLLTKASPDTMALSNTIGFSQKNPQICYYITRAYQHCAIAGKQPFYRPRSYMSSPCIKLIHRSTIGNIRFDTRFRNGEDSLFMFCISKNLRFVDFTTSDVLYYRRYRIGSASRGRNLDEKTRNAFRLCCAYSSIYWKEPLSYNFVFYVTRLLGSIKSVFVD